MPESAVNTRRGNIQPTALSESSERLAHILQYGAANITLSPRPTHPQPQHTIQHTTNNTHHTQLRIAANIVCWNGHPHPDTDPDPDRETVPLRPHMQSQNTEI